MPRSLTRGSEVALRTARGLACVTPRLALVIHSAFAPYAVQRANLRRTRTLLCMASLCFAAVFAHPREARAEVALSIAPECGSNVAFISELRDRHGLGTEDLALRSLQVAVRSGSQYVLMIDGPEGFRELVHADCQTLLRTALVIAASSAQPQTPAAPAPPSEEGPEPNLPPEPRRTPGASDVLGVKLGAATGVEFNLAPDPAWLFEVHAALASGPFGASLAGRYVPPNAAEGLTKQQKGLEVQALGGRLGFSYAPLHWARVELGLSVDRLGAEGRGVRRPSFDSVWIAVPDLEFALVPARLGAFAFELALRARVTINRPQFVVEPDAVEVYRLPRFGATGLFRMNWGS